MFTFNHHFLFLLIDWELHTGGHTVVDLGGDSAQLDAVVRFVYLLLSLDYQAIKLGERSIHFNFK